MMLSQDLKPKVSATYMIPSSKTSKVPVPILFKQNPIKF
jgi:hypothetical protein